MNPIKKLLDKQTTRGKTIRTWLQAVVGICGFFIGLAAVPGLSDFVLSNGWATVGTIASFVAVVTLIQNAIEDFIEKADEE